MTEQVATILAGQTYIDVTHNCPFTPTVDDIRITPKDSLGARSWFVDPIGAVTFRLNISSADGGSNHVFGWKIPQIEYSPTTDRYGILVTVKNLLSIDLAETSLDVQLDEIIKTADNIINVALERCGATVPLTSPEDIIRDISDYLAAGLYKQKDVPDEKVHSFYTIGINLLNEYIATNYPGESLVPATPTTTESTNQTLAYNVGTAT